MDTFHAVLVPKKSLKMKKNPTRISLTFIFLFKVNSRNTRARCEICSQLTIKTLERSHWQVNNGWAMIFS